MISSVNNMNVIAINSTEHNLPNSITECIDARRRRVNAMSIVLMFIDAQPNLVRLMHRSYRLLYPVADTTDAFYVN